MIEAKFHEEKLRLQQKHDAAVQKVLELPYFCWLVGWFEVAGCRFLQCCSVSTDVHNSALGVVYACLII